MKTFETFFVNIPSPPEVFVNVAYMYEHYFIGFMVRQRTCITKSKNYFKLQFDVENENGLVFPCRPTYYLCAVYVDPLARRGRKVNSAAKL